MITHNDKLVHFEAVYQPAMSVSHEEREKQKIA